MTQADHKLSTHLIHHPYKAPTDFEGPQPAVHKASTVYFANVQAMRERRWLDKSSYTYGLHGTPTTYALEERLASLEGPAMPAGAQWTGRDCHGVAGAAEDGRRGTGSRQRLRPQQDPDRRRWPISASATSTTTP